VPTRSQVDTISAYYCRGLIISNPNPGFGKGFGEKWQGFFLTRTGVSKKTNTEPGL